MNSKDLKEDVWRAHDPHDRRSVSNLAAFLLYAYAESTARVHTCTNGPTRYAYAISLDGAWVVYPFARTIVYTNDRVDRLVKEIDARREERRRSWESTESYEKAQ